jgi:hypothetical protein
MKKTLSFALTVILTPILASAQGGVLSDAGQEKFLKTAKLVSSAEIGHGVTKPVKADLSDGKLKHSASVQRVTKELSNFFGSDGTQVPMMDHWRFNIAAYRIDRLLKLNMVPVTVSRPYQAKPAAFSWWVDNVQMEEAERRKKEITPPDPEAFNRQVEIARVFDELVINIDRNHANLLITKDWQVKLIDHSRTFTAYPKIRNVDNLTRISKSLLASLKALKQADVEAAVTTNLKPAEVKALMARRDLIVQFFEKKAREKGEAETFIP